jgi:hypothetical protein
VQHPDAGECELICWRYEVALGLAARRGARLDT